MPATSTTLSTIDLLFGGETMTLLSQRAVWWARGETLFISDTHFGKEATFRAATMPVPDQTAEALERLTFLLNQTAAGRLVILGDLIHSRRGRCTTTFELITRWRSLHSTVEIDLIRGNHDESSGDPPAEWRMQCYPEPREFGPFMLRHQPESLPGESVLAGHLHPTVRLNGPGKDSAKLACFHRRDNVLTLPAFSAFVDGAALRLREGDHVFAICDGRVLRLA